MYLLATNIISELRRKWRANYGVQVFFESVDQGDLFLSAVTIGEIRKGIEMVRHRGDIAGADKLEFWLLEVRQVFGARILRLDEDIAEIWGRLMVPDKAHPLDKQIAATALAYGLTVVTRNVSDFTATGCRVHNPFI